MSSQNLDPGSTLDAQKGSLSDYASLIAQLILTGAAKGALDSKIESTADITSIKNTALGFIP